MRSRHLLVGNWKMNFGPEQTTAYCRQLAGDVAPLNQTDVWISPPLVSLAAATHTLGKNHHIKVGAQNAHWAETGAFTGETAPSFVAELGCTFAIVGHSERRTVFGESSEMVARRTKGVLSAGLDAIVCIGEQESERAEGATETVLGDQLAPVLRCLSAETAKRVIIAYEPVWAIGTGKVASIAEIAAAHSFIGTVWRGSGFPDTPPILYGGSVNPQNFSDILSLGEVDGALVGGASLKLDQWRALIEIAEKTPIEG